LDIKNIDWAATDALCFDMDGTLWDAVDSYCEIWNRCFRKVGMDRVVARQELIACMGLNLHEILRRLCGGVPMPDADAFLSDIEREEIRLMPVLGGKPYPGVAEGLERLSKKYKILLLSNCGENGLENLMNFLGIRALVTEAVTYGATHRDKNENLTALAEKYSLRQLVYVGDTEGDCRQTHIAGMPFVFASYGFGHCGNADMTVGSFEELVETFDKIK
jgi:predicted phosphatase of HAD hydrolase superfamily protein